MKIGLVGLGRMGANMRERLQAGGHTVVGCDAASGIGDVDTLDDLVAALDGPRTVWVMVPAGEATRTVIARLAELLTAGDLVIDGGNSRFTDDDVHAALLADHGIAYLDCGVSGGVWGRTEGYGLMVGGDDADVARAMPIFDALRPAGPRENGFSHAGPTGAGHYAKMVHNGIEYGLMHAYAEGYELLSAEGRIANPDTVIRGWQSGTVVRSWLLELLAAALAADPELAAISDYAEDSGEGRWTVEEAVDHAVPGPVIAAALFARFSSRQPESPAMKAVAALRHQFGGHAVQTAGASA